jgi:hypothetical protein
MINFSKHLGITSCAFVIFAPLAFGQATDQAEPKTSRLHIGIQINYLPQRLFTTQYATASSTVPILSYAYFGSSPGAHYWLGLTGEYQLTSHLSVGAEFFHHQAEYTQLTQIKSGVQDPTSSYDNRQVTSITEDTRAAYWDVPFVARYYSFHESSRRSLSWIKDVYAVGGVTYRHAGNIRTGTSTSNADSSTAYNEVATKPLHTNLAGFVAGAGYKLFEYGKFKSMIDARYTRWSGSTFQGPSFRSQQNQVQLGINFTY